MKRVSNCFINDVKNALFTVILGISFCLIGNFAFQLIGFVIICIGVFIGVSTNLDENEEDEIINSEKGENVETSIIDKEDNINENFK